MSRHTSPNKRRVDDAFPIRVKVKVPTNGFGNVLHDMHVWLRDNMGKGRTANQSSTGIYCEAMAFYFRDIADAMAFLDAFPLLELADGVSLAGFDR